MAKSRTGYTPPLDDETSRAISARLGAEIKDKSPIDVIVWYFNKWKEKDVQDQRGQFDPEASTLSRMAKYHYERWAYAMTKLEQPYSGRVFFDTCERNGTFVLTGESPTVNTNARKQSESFVINIFHPAMSNPQAIKIIENAINQLPESLEDCVTSIKRAVADYFNALMEIGPYPTVAENKAYNQQLLNGLLNIIYPVPDINNIDKSISEKREQFLLDLATKVAYQAQAHLGEANRASLVNDAVKGPVWDRNVALFTRVLNHEYKDVERTYDAVRSGQAKRYEQFVTSLGEFERAVNDPKNVTENYREARKNEVIKYLNAISDNTQSSAEKFEFDKLGIDAKIKIVEHLKSFVTVMKTKPKMRKEFSALAQPMINVVTKFITDVGRLEIEQESNYNEIMKVDRLNRDLRRVTEALEGFGDRKNPISVPNAAEIAKNQVRIDFRAGQLYQLVLLSELEDKADSVLEKMNGKPLSIDEVKKAVGYIVRFVNRQVSRDNPSDSTFQKNQYDVQMAIVNKLGELMTNILNHEFIPPLEEDRKKELDAAFNQFSCIERFWKLLKPEQVTDQVMNAIHELQSTYENEFRRKFPLVETTTTDTATLQAPHVHGR